MKRIALLFFIICNLIFAFTGKVTKVADGDTITVLTDGKSVRIRFYGIDAPEKKQDYGIKSLDVLKKLLDGKTVEIEEKDKDQYGRVVGVVFLNGENINLKQVAEGNAWWYKQYAKKDMDLKTAEEKAREKKIGLWQNSEPMAPWEFRRKNK
ncbi:MAG: thermonuclease family protein [Fusobacteriaceae bacterium]